MRKGLIEGIVFGLCALAAFGVLCGITSCNISTDPSPHAPPTASNPEFETPEEPVILHPSDYLRIKNGQATGMMVILHMSWLKHDLIDKIIMSNLDVLASNYASFSGDHANGERAHYRYPEPCAFYGIITYQVILKDGRKLPATPLTIDVTHGLDNVYIPKPDNWEY